MASLTRRERRTLAPFSKQPSKESSRIAPWDVSQKLPTPPGKLEPFTAFLDCQGVVCVCPVCAPLLRTCSRLCLISLRFGLKPVCLEP